MLRALRTFQLPYPIVAVAMGTLVSRFGTALVLPYVTVFLVETKHLPIYFAGITIGISYLAEAFGTSLTIKLLNSIKLFALMKGTIVVYASLFIGMGLISEWVNSLWLLGFGFMVCFLLSGMCRSLIENAGQVIISSLTPMHQKNFAFSLRYVFINIGTSLGALFALLLGILKVDVGFYAAGTAILFYFCLLQLTVKARNFTFIAHAKTNIANVFKLLFSDRRLLYFMLASILCYVGFSQLQTLFAYVVYQRLANPHVFPLMYVINGFTVVLLQIPLTQYAKRLNIHFVIMCGISLLAAGLVGVAFSNTSYFSYYLSSFIFSLGEIFTLSLIGVYIDQLAPPEKRYMYFSISGFALIGAVIGPALATALCTYLGLSDGLISIALLTLLGLPCLWLAKRKTVQYAAAETNI